jgi:myo-inositol catabolism protein IolC
MPKESAAILVDEEFGDELLRDAHDNGYTIILTVEKSGQEEFQLEYGDDFAEHVKKYDPTFIKALIHYNPEGNREVNARQRESLAKLTDFAYLGGYRLLIEPLIPATVEQLSKVGSDPDRYDRELRPELTVRMIKELQDGNVNPDVWKIEGMNKPEDYEMAVKQARFSGRDSVGIVVLGRAADDTKVESWIKAGAAVNGVIGFAIGRTIFWDAISEFEEGKKNEEETANAIGEKFLHYYKLFIETRSGL